MNMLENFLLETHRIPVESAAVITSMAKQVITLFILLHVMAAPPPHLQH